MLTSPFGHVVGDEISGRDNLSSIQYVLQCNQYLLVS